MCRESFFTIYFNYRIQLKNIVKQVLTEHFKKLAYGIFTRESQRVITGRNICLKEEM